MEQPSADIHVDAQHSGSTVKVEVVTPVKKGAEVFNTYGELGNA